jgi:ketosteroid isomerase-like protein
MCATYRCSNDSERRPTVIVIGGGETFCEELYFCGGAGAVSRGYNALLVDMPGQGATLAQDGTWVLKSNPFDWPEIRGGHDHPHGGHGSNVEEEIKVMLKVMDKLREVDSRPDTPEALQALRTSIVRSRELNGFARMIAMTGLDPIDLGERTF